jgi:hypothetical protein
MLADFLKKNRAAILNEWRNRTIETYHHPETQNFLKNQGNAFANPVGAAISGTVENLYDWLLGDSAFSREKAVFDLDCVVRIRAVQEFSPSDAVGFVFLLKAAVREALKKESNYQSMYGELLAFESKVDDLALMAFEVYAKCRDKLHEIRSMELRNRTSRILERACQKYGMPHEW